MTEDEVLAQLRDIHVPADAASAPASGFAAWPLLILATVVAVLVVVRVWRARRWRRKAKAELREIVREPEHAVQWPLLLAFAATLPERAGRSITLPPVAYRHPDAISDADRAALIGFLSTELDR